MTKESCCGIEFIQDGMEYLCGQLLDNGQRIYCYRCRGKNAIKKID